MRSKYVTFLKDTNGKYLHVSGSFMECFGIHPSKLINRTASEFFNYDVARELEAGDRCAVETGKTDTRIISWAHADGTPMLWMIKKSVVKDGLIIGMAFDITAYIKNHSSGDLRPPMNETHNRMVESSLGSYSA